MPLTNSDVQLYYEVSGSGVPIVFVHEFAGEHKSWQNQVKYFSKKYQVITYNARGYPPSDVPKSEKNYSQTFAVQDILSILDELNIQKAWEIFKKLFQNSSSLGHANTMLGVQRNRPSILSLEKEMKGINIPTLIITGDEDEPCLEPSIFMKRCISTSGLLIVPNTGHTVNLEEPDLFNQMIEKFLNQVENGSWPLRDPRSWSKSALLPDKEKNE